MEKQEKQAVFLLILVLGIVSGAHLLLTVLGNSLFAVPYAADVPEGRMVLLEGAVERVTITQEGGHRILRVRDVQVFVPSAVVSQREIRVGSYIRGYGTVQTYRGEREVLIARASDLTIY